MVKNKKTKTLPELFEFCDAFIEFIYRLEEYHKEGKKRVFDRVVWRITSHKIDSHEHTDKKGVLRFSGPTCYDAMLAFYNYLKKKRKI